MRFLTTLYLLSLLFISSCSDDAPCSCPKDSLTDDSILTVTIGSQIWMSRNLEVTKFKNGDSILQAKSEADWISAKENQKPAWCYYSFDEKNGKIYGKLYNWYAVKDSRGLAPNGYHVPSDNEWGTLIDFLGGANNAGGKLKSTSGWQQNGNGTNNTGFNAIPGGYCHEEGKFEGIGAVGFWWTSTDNSQFNQNSMVARRREISYAGSGVGGTIAYYDNGYSVRCLRD
jgi:uncharacterized protein (TIGR02145 family)